MAIDPTEAVDLAPRIRKIFTWIGLLFFALFVINFVAIIRLLVLVDLENEAEFLFELLAKDQQIAAYHIRHHPSFLLCLDGQIFSEHADGEHLKDRVPKQVQGEGQKIRPAWVNGKPRALLHIWRDGHYLVLSRQLNSNLYVLFALAVIGVTLLALMLRFKKSVPELRNPVVQRFDELAARDRAKEAFFAGIFHDLGTPLTSLMSRLERLLETDSGHRVELRKMYLDAQSLAMISADQLQRARMEAGTFRINRYSIFVDELFDVLSIRLEHALAHYGMELAVKVSDDLQLYADRLKLEQVLTNLLTNAMKYGKAKQTIRLHAKKENTWILIEVLDEGEGFDLESEDHLKEAFQRSESRSHQGFTESTGLGLYLSHHIVKAHGGTLSFHRQDSLFVARVALPS